MLPHRSTTGHKGTFGSVAILGGCARKPTEEAPAAPMMIGGPAFAAIAALRSGCGLVRLVLPEPILAATLAIAPSATGIALSVDHEGDLVPHLAAAAIDDLLNCVQCLAVGPGMGVSRGSASAILRCIAQDQVPLVLDADALNTISEIPELHRDFRAPAVLTPHIGEFRRLAATLGITADPENPAQRTAAAEALAQKLGCIVVLKSSITIVSDGHQSYTHDEANPALATAGTGDVLCGIIAGLISQHFIRPIIAGSRTMSEESQGGLSLYNCACAAVRAHSLAARSWSDRAHASGGMLATDLLESIPAAVQSLRAPR